MTFAIPPLERQLLYSDHSELSQIIGDNTLLKELYKVYLRTKDLEYRWKVSPVDTFDEVMYQLTRIKDDPNPEADVYRTYLNDSKDNIGTRYGSNLIFCMVWALIKLMPNPGDNMEYFVAELEKNIDNTIFFGNLCKFVADMQVKGVTCEIDFHPTPVDPSHIILTAGARNWQRVTNNYDEYQIRKLVMRYKTKEQRLAVLNMIEEEFNTPEPAENSPFNFDNVPF